MCGGRLGAPSAGDAREAGPKPSLNTATHTATVEGSRAVAGNSPNVTALCNSGPFLKL
jgi:hypothetical protein